MTTIYAVQLWNKKQLKIGKITYEFEDYKYEDEEKNILEDIPLLVW